MVQLDWGQTIWYLLSKKENSKEKKALPFFLLKIVHLILINFRIVQRREENKLKYMFLNKQDLLRIF